MDDKIGYRLAQTEISLLLATLTRNADDVDRCVEQAEALKRLVDERNGSMDPAARRDVLKLHTDISALVKQIRAPYTSAV